METNLSFPCGLYPQLLDASWGQLDEPVRRMHSAGAIAEAAGTFRVRHGSNGLVRLLARLAGLPAAGQDVPVRLIITPLANGEEWLRTFAGRPLMSRQGLGPDGLLAERVGAVELRFRLKVDSGGLFYETRSAALCLGPLRIPMPRFVIPRVTAWEKAAGKGDLVQIAVEVSLPLVGLLIAYEGTLTRIETRP
jgi:hypothetical protein